MDNNIKQDIELIVYYFSNGTINLNKSNARDVDYRDIVIDNPELYSIFGLMFMESLEVNADIKVFKSEILELIYNYDPNGYKRINETDKVDFYSVAKRFFNYIAFDVSQNKEWFSNLMKYGNDIQLIFCIWGNNLQIDKKGRVLNEDSAKVRAVEFIESIFDNKMPEKDFESWEMIHNT